MNGLGTKRRRAGIDWARVLSPCIAVDGAGVVPRLLHANRRSPANYRHVGGVSGSRHVIGVWQGNIYRISGTDIIPRRHGRSRERGLLWERFGYFSRRLLGSGRQVEFHRHVRADGNSGCNGCYRDRWLELRRNIRGYERRRRTSSVRVAAVLRDRVDVVCERRDGRRRSDELLRFFRSHLGRGRVGGDSSTKLCWGGIAGDSIRHLVGLWPLDVLRIGGGRMRWGRADGFGLAKIYRCILDNERARRSVAVRGAWVPRSDVRDAFVRHADGCRKGRLRRRDVHDDAERQRLQARHGDPLQHHHEPGVAFRLI